MAEYANVKRKKLLNVLQWLEQSKGVEVINGKKHTKVRIIHNGKAFMIPTSHRVINKHIIASFVKFLEENQIVTKRDFDNKL